MTDTAVTEVIALDIAGDYGHFRKSFTTSSPLTHGAPPRTALAGLLGAIMGYPPRGPDNYHEIFEPTNAKIAVVPKSPIQTQRINKNMLKIKGETEKLTGISETPKEITRNQVPFELLRQPAYRLYIWHRDEDRFEELREQFAAHRSVYTPSLGISELLAEFEYQGTFSVSKIGGDALIDSIVNVDENDVVFQPGQRYQRENISLIMDEQRIVQEFADVMYSEYRKGGDSPEECEPGDPAPLTIDGGPSFKVQETGETITFLTG